jgi:hypothetical protein
VNEPLLCTVATPGTGCVFVPWVRVKVTVVPPVKFAPVTVTVVPERSTVLGDALIEAGGGGGGGVGLGLGTGLGIGVGGCVGVGLGAGWEVGLEVG